MPALYVFVVLAGLRGCEAELLPAPLGALIARKVGVPLFRLEALLRLASNAASRLGVVLQLGLVSVTEQKRGLVTGGRRGPPLHSGPGCGT